MLLYTWASTNDQKLYLYWSCLNRWTQVYVAFYLCFNQWSKAIFTLIMLEPMNTSVCCFLLVLQPMIESYIYIDHAWTDEHKCMLLSTCASTNDQKLYLHWSCLNRWTQVYVAIYLCFNQWSKGIFTLIMLYKDLFEQSSADASHPLKVIWHISCYHEDNCQLIHSSVGGEKKRDVKGLEGMGRERRWWAVGGGGEGMMSEIWGRGRRSCGASDEEGGKGVIYGERME